MNEGRYREARERCGLDFDEAARLLGIECSELSSYENDATQPDALMVGQMARLYGVSSDWLIGLVE